jgi:hypothetical protein
MLKNVLWAEDHDYNTGTDDEPLQFYIDAFVTSTNIDIVGFPVPQQ